MNKGLKNKGLGSWFCLAAALVALITGIVFLLTQATAAPLGHSGTMAGVVLLVGAAASLVFFFVSVPFSALIQAVIYNIALYLVVVQLYFVFADVINHVTFAGGNAGLCVFYMVGTFIACLLSVIACFCKQTKTGEAKATGKQFAAAGAVVVVAAVSVGGFSLQRSSLPSAARAEEAAEAAQTAADAATSAPSAEILAAAQDALAKVQDKKAALYARLDDLADALGCDRGEAIDLIDKASKIDTDNDDIHPVNTIDNGAGAIAQAEKYAVYQLQYDRGDGNGEETISVYGISSDSRYWKDLNVGDGRVVFGGGLLDKFGWSEGQKVTLGDKYEGEHYSLEYAGKDCAWGSKSDMNIYMSIEDFNELFGNDAAYFNGYVSDEKLDLDSRYFAGDTTPDDMRAVGDQFIGMMSKMIGMMIGLAVFIFLLFMYLLTKAVIDHSARSISYMKVFGYRDSEISHLYIRSITLCVAASLVLSLPVIIGSLTAIFRSMLLAYNGNIEIYAPAWSKVACVGIGFATYLVVALLHMRSIKRVGLAEALKVQE